jgi:hypothetical protein
MGYEPTPADQLLASIYGDYVHSNDGCHLDGGVTDDHRWQWRWRRVVQHSPTRYSVPRGRIGRRFLATLTREFRGVRQRHWNSERPLVYAAVILQASPGVRRARNIRRRLERRMDCWDQGHFTALIDDSKAEMKANARPRNRQADPEVTARAFDARVLTGRRSAVRHLTSREGGGVLQPADLCTKSGRPVVEVLREKHPDLREPPSVGAPDGAFEPYARGAPAVVPVDVTATTVETVAAKLSGAAGPGGVDAADLWNWLLRFGVESDDLREEMAAMTAWLANMHPPWAAYRALMACRLVALEKQPGVRPVGIGES